jgi:uncharacterized YigZ family protein
MKKYYYQTIKEQITHELPKTKWSRFIGNIFYIQNEQEANKYIQETKEKYKDANHNCFAYTYGTNINFDLFWNIKIDETSFKQNDDWEPSNTAWKPILAQLKWHKLNNLLIIVTRYFWWTLLGIWWLIQAYWECTKQTIQKAKEQHKIINIELTQNLTINIEYNQISIIMRLLNKYQAQIIKQKDWQKSQITFAINKWYIDTFKQDLSNQTKGQITL